MLSLSMGISRWKIALALLAVAGTLFIATGFSPRDKSSRGGLKPPADSVERWARVKATGYCKCERCCSWRYSLFGLGPPVIASGPNRGRPKAVGITAMGTRARPGVIAADTNLFAFGTVMFVPGYGWGRVEDIGGAIKGYHIDLYFIDHATAAQWGVQKKKIRFWRPAGQKPKNVRIADK